MLEHTAQRMGRTLVHRGPDDEGIWSDGTAGVALAHRRLAILDLSPAGHQPMVSTSGRYVIAFNGEVYNFREIKNQLAAGSGRPATGGSRPPVTSHKLPVWRGHSDTEVILAAIEQWGLDAAIRRFVGMFAFALWDRQERTLTLVRDRLGEKPLYYGWQDNAFLFGSELKALRAHPAWQGDIDRNALALYMRYSYVPAPYSIYTGIHKLPPGTMLTIPGNISPSCLPDPRPYWSARRVAEDGLAHPLQCGDAEAMDQLDELLRNTIREKMVADVPLGAFLSGGIDSSTVTALMQAVSGRSVKTFSIGFHEPGYNEAPHAAAVAGHLGTEHTELYVTPTEAMDVIPRLPDIYDEPFADVSQVPTFLVSQMTRQHVTVALSGDGGDELFGGYNRYFLACSIWRRASRIPAGLRRLMAGMVLGVSPRVWNRLFALVGPLLPGRLSPSLPGDKLHKLAGILVVTRPEEMYRRLVSHWEYPCGVVPGSEEYSSVPVNHSLCTVHDFSQRMMFMDTVSYLPDDILCKVDRAAMSVSLETRMPFLDHRVVEFAWRLPLSMKIRQGQGKWILRQVLHRYVPRELIERPKMGFGVPIDVWLRGPLRGWAEELLSGERLREEGFFNSDAVHEKWREHQSGQRNWQYHLWNVLMFQLWRERWQG